MSDIRRLMFKFCEGSKENVKSAQLGFELGTTRAGVRCLKLPKRLYKT